MAEKNNQPFRRKSDSATTYALKWAAWEWLHEEKGCRAIGFEVRLEGPRGRVADVVGVGPKNRVFVVEVKASRSDRARDDNDERDRTKLSQREGSLIGAVELAGGILEAAAEYAGAASDESDYEWRSDPAYRQASADHDRAKRKLAAHQRRMETFSTKFRDPAYLRTAHCHYIMAPRGLVRRHELPPYWGLLDDTPRLVVEAPVKQIQEATAHVLRNIARANTSAMMSEYRKAPNA